MLLASLGGVEVVVGVGGIFGMVGHNGSMIRPRLRGRIPRDAICPRAGCLTWNSSGNDSYLSGGEIWAPLTAWCGVGNA
jgi:hypothetical protein